MFHSEGSHHLKINRIIYEFVIYNICSGLKLWLVFTPDLTIILEFVAVVKHVSLIVS